MKGFRVYYDYDNGLFACDDHSTQVGKMTDFVYWMDSQEHAKEAVKYSNDTKLLRIHKCRECGELFYLEPTEKAWFVDRGLEIPKRCPSCRKKRKGLNR